MLERERKRERECVELPYSPLLTCRGNIAGSIIDSERYLLFILFPRSKLSGVIVLIYVRIYRSLSQFFYESFNFVQIIEAILYH